MIYLHCKFYEVSWAGLRFNRIGQVWKLLPAYIFWGNSKKTRPEVYSSDLSQQSNSWKQLTAPKISAQKTPDTSGGTHEYFQVIRYPNQKFGQLKKKKSVTQSVSELSVSLSLQENSSILTLELNILALNHQIHLKFGILINLMI